MNPIGTPSDLSPSEEKWPEGDTPPVAEPLYDFSEFAPLNQRQYEKIVENLLTEYETQEEPKIQYAVANGVDHAVYIKGEGPDDDPWGEREMRSTIDFDTSSFNILGDFNGIPNKLSNFLKKPSDSPEEKEDILTKRISTRVPRKRELEEDDDPLCEVEARGSRMKKTPLPENPVDFLNFLTSRLIEGDSIGTTLSNFAPSTVSYSSLYDQQHDENLQNAWSHLVNQSREFTGELHNYHWPEHQIERLLAFCFISIQRGGTEEEGVRAFAKSLPHLDIEFIQTNLDLAKRPDLKGKRKPQSPRIKDLITGLYDKTLKSEHIDWLQGIVPEYDALLSKADALEKDESDSLFTEATKIVRVLTEGLSQGQSIQDTIRENHKIFDGCKQISYASLYDCLSQGVFPEGLSEIEQRELREAWDAFIKASKDTGPSYMDLLQNDAHIEHLLTHLLQTISSGNDSKLAVANFALNTPHLPIKSIEAVLHCTLRRAIEKVGEPLCPLAQDLATVLHFELHTKKQAQEQGVSLLRELARLLPRMKGDILKTPYKTRLDTNELARALIRKLSLKANLNSPKEISLSVYFAMANIRGAYHALSHCPSTKPNFWTKLAVEFYGIRDQLSPGKFKEEQYESVMTFLAEKKALGLPLHFALTLYALDDGRARICQNPWSCFKTVLIAAKERSLASFYLDDAHKEKIKQLAKPFLQLAPGGHLI